LLAGAWRGKSRRSGVAAPRCRACLRPARLVCQPPAL